jgi:hypothetical protein
VAQPEIQTRIVSSGSLPLNNSGTALFASFSKASRSRKKVVTEISRSPSSACASSALSRNTS